MTSFALILFAALFFDGLIVRTKSVCSERKGPGVFQPLKDVARLMRKGAVYSPTTGWVFKAAPIVQAASVVMACAVIPLGEDGALLSFRGDFVFFAYVLALGKFFGIVGALDTGSSFEGMGAAREALYSMLAEPAFFMVVGSLSLLTGFVSFADILPAIHLSGAMSCAIAVVAAGVLLVLELIENSRLPVDDPKTHLELTMVHEVIANLFVGSVPDAWDVPAFLAVQAASAVSIGVVESFMARARMNHNPQFIFALTSVALLLVFGVLLAVGNFR